MKHVYSVLVLALVLAVVLWAPAPAGIIRGENYDLPGSGGGIGDDGDHPWGGDEVSGGGSTTTTVLYKFTAATGFPAMDALINVLLSEVYGDKTTTVTKMGQSATLSASGGAIRTESAVLSSRKQSVSIRKER